VTSRGAVRVGGGMMVDKRELREGGCSGVIEALKQGVTHMTNARARQGMTRRRTHGKDIAGDRKTYSYSGRK